MGVAVGDYLHNGRFSVFVTNFADEYNTLYRNDGDDGFTDVSFAANVAQVSRPYVGWGTSFFDLDNDTWLDLLASRPRLPADRHASVCARYRPPKLLPQPRGGAFATQRQRGGPEVARPRGAPRLHRTTDHVDVVVTTSTGRRVCVTRAARQPLYYGVAAATKGNPLAIGARPRRRLRAQTEKSAAANYLRRRPSLHFG